MKVKKFEAVNDNDWHPKFRKDMDRMDTIMKCVFSKKQSLSLLLLLLLLLLFTVYVNNIMMICTTQMVKYL